jgi:tetratricopeptide (TPR) repeat protein
MTIKKFFLNISAIFIASFIILGSLECILRVRDAWLARNNNIESKLKASISNKRISDKTFNIYYFGGSTMVGEPYAPSLSIPRLVNYMLDNKVRDKEIRFVNIAQSGVDLKYNFDRLKMILAKKDVFHPSLCIIYSGHNEFLKYHRSYYGFGRQRINSGIIRFINNHSSIGRRIIARIASRMDIYRLEIDERRLFDQPLCERTEYKNTVEIYKAEIIDAIELSHKYGVPIIISTVTGNYADWEPNRSIWYEDDTYKEQYNKLIDKAKEAQSRKEVGKAIECYLEALSFCEDFAETHYSLGKCYEMQKDYVKAWEEYKKAIDYDGMPIRAIEAQNDFIRKLREDNIAFTVDTIEYLKKNSEHGLIGFNLMIDDCHPNMTGYILISRLIAEKIKKIFDEPNGIRLINKEEARQVFNIDNPKMFDVCIKSAGMFTKLATWRYDSSERLRIAEKYFLDAMAIDASRCEPYLGLAICSFLHKDTKKAEAYLFQAETINHRVTDAYLKRFWIKQIINRAYLK